MNNQELTITTPNHKDIRRSMKILICLNGRQYAQAALAFGAELLKAISAEVTLLFVQHPLSSSTPNATFQAAESVLPPETWAVKTKVAKGPLDEEIDLELKRGKYDLLVLGSLPSSELLEGNKEVSYLKEMEEKILQTCNTSLLVVKHPKPIHKVLLCTDGSAMALGSLLFFARLRLNPPPRMNIINVVPEIYARFEDILAPVGEQLRDTLATLPGKRTAYLYQAKEILSRFKLDAKVKLREGDASQEILTEAQNDYDLIVMGAGGRKGDAKETLGRQTRRVIRTASVPVLAIRNVGI